MLCTSSFVNDDKSSSSSRKDVAEQYCTTCFPIMDRVTHFNIRAEVGHMRLSCCCCCQLKLTMFCIRRQPGYDSTRKVSNSGY